MGTLVQICSDVRLNHEKLFKKQSMGSMENIRLGNVISVPMQTARGENSCNSETPATHSPTHRGMKSSFAWV